MPTTTAPAPLAPARAGRREWAALAVLLLPGRPAPSAATARPTPRPG